MKFFLGCFVFEITFTLGHVLRLMGLQNMCDNGSSTPHAHKEKTISGRTFFFCEILILFFLL